MQKEPVALILPRLSSKFMLSTVLILSGVFVLLSRVLIPVVTIYAQSESIRPVVSPLPDKFKSSVDLSNEDDNEGFTFKELEPGFTLLTKYESRDGILYQASDEAKKAISRNDAPPHFYLTIPKLQIEDAKVDVNSVNLDPALALGHYNGSCLPDEDCNVFIYGHSNYSPGNTDNKYKEGDYRYIFKDLDKLEYGDEFCIRYSDKNYCYVVELTKIEKPKDVNPLGSPLPRGLGRHDGSVELFTCTPSGTTLNRLSVVGRLVKVE